MILNLALFQAGWFACVLGAAHGYAREGALAAALIVAWHVARAARPSRELALAAAALFGLGFESALVQAQWVHYGAGVLLEGTAPYWMVALWALFATTLNASLRPLQARLWLAAALGGIGGPLAYAAGARLGALDFVQPAALLAALALGWALATPLLLSLARHLHFRA